MVQGEKNMIRDAETYCARCSIEFEMVRNPDKPWSIVMPPHHPDCPKIAHSKPRPLTQPPVEETE